MSKRMICKWFEPRMIALGMLLLGFFPLIGFGQLVQDGSFEAISSNTPGTEGWQFCQGEPDQQILDGYGAGIYGINTPPALGQRYLGMIDATVEVQEAIGQAVKLDAGEHFYGSVALFRSMAHQNWNGVGQLQIWGGSDCNDLAELLWTSGPVTNVDEWAYFPIEFTPTQNHRWMSLMVELEAGSGEMTYLCIDDLYLANGFLAVDFMSFVAQPEGEAIQLSWETATLLDAEAFLVEWSTDGIGFTQVGQVHGLAGQAQFAFAHTPDAAGLQYYRLKAVDQGGATSYSEVRQVYWGLSDALQVYPNPASDHISLNTAEAMRALRIIDMNGRVVMTAASDGSPFARIALPAHLMNGCYELQVQTATRLLRQRLVVQR
jgi:hypothetical protein